MSSRMMELSKSKHRRGNWMYKFSLVGCSILLAACSGQNSDMQKVCALPPTGLVLSDAYRGNKLVVPECYLVERTVLNKYGPGVAFALARDAAMGGQGEAGASGAGSVSGNSGSAASAGDGSASASSGGSSASAGDGSASASSGGSSSAAGGGGASAAGGGGASAAGGGGASAAGGGGASGPEVVVLRQPEAAARRQRGAEVHQPLEAALRLQLERVERRLPAPGAPLQPVAAAREQAGGATSETFALFSRDSRLGFGGFAFGLRRVRECPELYGAGPELGVELELWFCFRQKRCIAACPGNSECV
jgi:hypothetical protein